MKTVKEQFLTDTDHTGRFIVTSIQTGRKYYVEPIGTTKTAWGDINPATGKVEGHYGSKYRGSIAKSESLISDENGFDKIHNIPPGLSPLAYIENLDAKYDDA